MRKPLLKSETSQNWSFGVIDYGGFYNVCVNHDRMKSRDVRWKDLIVTIMSRQKFTAKTNIPLVMEEPIANHFEEI